MNDNRAFIILRVGLAFAFLYPAMSAVFWPSSWVGYIPAFARGVLPDLVLLNAFGAFEALLALWILSGRHIFLPSLAAGMTLVAIVLFNPQEFPIVFRDLSIAAMAFALAFMSAPKNNEKKADVV